MRRERAPPHEGPSGAGCGWRFAHRTSCRRRRSGPSDGLGEAVLDEERRALDPVEILGKRLWRGPTDIVPVHVVEPTVARAEKLPQAVFPSHWTFHMGADVREDPVIRIDLHDIDGQLDVGAGPLAEREGDLELGRLPIGYVGDVAHFTPDRLLAAKDGREDEADDGNAEQHRDRGTRYLSAKERELAATQPPRITMRHSE